MDFFDWLPQAPGDIIGEITGSNRAAAAQKKAGIEAREALRKAQEQGIASLDAAERAALASLDASESKFLSSWDSVSRPNLDAEYDMRWKDAERNINAAGAKTGTYDSGAWRTATARA